MGKRSFTNGVVGALAITAAAGCGEPFSLTTSTSGGASTSTSSGAGSGGAGGGGMSGQCTPGDLTSCKAGSYCKQDSMTCDECKAVTSRFSFGAPRKINLSLPAGSSNPRFPRSGPDGQLLFSFNYSGTNVDLGHAAPGNGFLEWAQGTVEPTPPNSGAEDASPLYLSKGSVLATLVNGSVITDASVVLFESNTLGNKGIFAFNPSQTTTSPTSPVALNGGTTNFHITVAPDVPRFWYISNALKGAADPADFVELVTAVPKGDPAKVKILDSAGCPVSGDVTPWATPGGDLLLFSAKRQEKGDAGSCSASSSDALHISYTPVRSTDGQQPDVEQARDLFPNDDKSYTAPALREDLCVLYFFSPVSATEAELYAAVRE